MLFQDICLVEQTEQKFHRTRDCLEQQRRKKHVTVIVGLFYSTPTDRNLNSRTAKDWQALVRICQVLYQSLHVPLLALQVLGNPGDTLPRTETQKNPKLIQALKVPNRCYI